MMMLGGESPIDACRLHTGRQSVVSRRVEVGLMVVGALSVELLLAGLAGGLLGAALGALPAFSLAGASIVVGEVVNIVAGDPSPATANTPAALDAVGLTGTVGFGPVLGPHVAFAGGAAAAAYVARDETADTTFRYHQAKQISKPLPGAPDVLLVGAAFGLVGVVLAQLTAAAGLPMDPIALAIVVSAFLHRLVLGYPLLGRVWDGFLDMTPYEEGEIHGAAGEMEANGSAGRQVVEPWQPDHYEWPTVAVLGAGVGLASGYIAQVTGSVFLAFGLTAASLAFYSLGHYSLPVTHHIALPASIVALAVPFADPIGLVVAALFGVIAALAGEFFERLFYARADTHLDPPAASIVLTSLLITLLVTAGLFDAGPVPYAVI